MIRAIVTLVLGIEIMKAIVVTIRRITTITVVVMMLMEVRAIVTMEVIVMVTTMAYASFWSFYVLG